jgi:hypothetical protein
MKSEPVQPYFFKYMISTYAKDFSWEKKAQIRQDFKFKKKSKSP